MKAHPDILAEHFAFRAKLRKDNPIRKDLSTAPQFHKFMRGEDGTEYVLLFFFLRYCVTVNCLCYVFSDTVQAQRTIMKVSLTDILQQPTPNQQDQDPIEQTIVEEVPLTCQTQCTASVPSGENPFNFTDGEIDEILRALEGGSILPNHDIDEDLGNVLDMSVEDFMV